MTESLKICRLVNIRWFINLKETDAQAYLNSEVRYLIFYCCIHNNFFLKAELREGNCCARCTNFLIWTQKLYMEIVQIALHLVFFLFHLSYAYCTVFVKICCVALVSLPHYKIHCISLFCSAYYTYNFVYIIQTWCFNVNLLWQSLNRTLNPCWFDFESWNQIITTL